MELNQLSYEIIKAAIKVHTELGPGLLENVYQSCMLVELKDRDLNVYRKAFDNAMEIFELTKNFPKEEKYSLTDQIRRASRSVCSNLSEGWRKRRYKAVFLNKLTDSGQEAAETQTWLEFSFHCKYINEETFHRLDKSYEHIFAMLYAMEKKADTFCRPSS